MHPFRCPTSSRTPSKFPPEISLGLVLFAAALSVVGLVLFADAEVSAMPRRRGPRRCVRSPPIARCWSFSSPRASPPRRAPATPAPQALDEARRMLAGDARALALLERLAPMAAVPPVADPGAMAALQELRSMLAASATAAAESARRDVERAHGITLAAGLLVTAVALGTVAVHLRGAPPAAAPRAEARARGEPRSADDAAEPPLLPRMAGLHARAGASRQARRSRCSTSISTASRR